MSLILIDAQTATGAGTAIHLARGISKGTVEIFFTGTVTSLVLTLEGTIDNSSQVNKQLALWFPLVTYTLSAAELAAKKAMFHYLDKPVESIRANVSTYAGTGPVSVLYLPDFSSLGGI